MDEPRPHPILTRGLHLFWRFSRGMTLGVRAVVIDEGERILLVRHTYVAGWHLPGGGVEVGETALEAVRRELVEEGGVASIGDPVLHGVFFNRRLSRRDHVLVYVVNAFRVVTPKRPDREIAEARFFRLDDLPANVTPGTRARIAEVVGGQAPSPEW